MPQHKRSIFVGLIAFGLAACHIVSPPHLPPATPSATPDVADYYGRPTPATLLIDGQSQAAGIGTSTWIASKSGDQGVTVHGDAFGIVTPREPLIVSSTFSATLQLPIPITPTELAYSVLPVSASEQRAPAAGDTTIWNVYYQPNRSQPLDAGQAVTLALQPGTYVLAVSATWAELGRVEYGFLLTVPSAIPAEPPANFALRFEYGPCFTDILDTFERTYTQDRVTEPPITIAVSLSGAQVRAIYEKSIEIDFFNYPEQFVVEPQGGVQYQYSLTVRAGDRTHTVAWHDASLEPSTGKAEQLRQLFQLVQDIVKEQPEVQQLPPRPIGCA